MPDLPTSTKLEVRLHLDDGDERVVGQLIEERARLFFEYDPTFLAAPLALSPFKLPLRPGLIEFRERDFGPIFGLFDDSLPDGWGLLLMNRYFQQEGRQPRDVSILERLAYLGTRTMGALTYHPPSESAEQYPRILNLHDLATASDQVLRGEARIVVPELLRAGGSPGGARPKVVVGINGDELLSGEDLLPPGFQAWIIKFQALQDSREDGAIELAYARMARAAGIHMPETRLFEVPEGGRYFGVRRFDRQDSKRFHVHTFGNLIHADFRLPSCDYQDLFKVTRRLTRRQDDLSQCFRQMIFNIATHNRDDHVKNFAFRLGHRGEWRLAPAYDLMYSRGPGGEHTTSVAGEGRAPGRSHAMKLATSAGLDDRRAAEIIEEVCDGVADFSRHARTIGVEPTRRDEIVKAHATCLKRLAHA